VYVRGGTEPSFIKITEDKESRGYGRGPCQRLPPLPLDSKTAFSTFIASGFFNGFTLPTAANRSLRSCFCRGLLYEAFGVVEAVLCHPVGVGLPLGNHLFIHTYDPIVSKTILNSGNNADSDN